MKTDSKIGAISILCMLGVLLSSLATGTPSRVILGGSLTGSDFRKMPEAERFAYLAGLIDGYFTAPRFSEASQSWKKLYSCLTQQDFDKQLRGNVAPSRAMS